MLFTLFDHIFQYFGTYLVKVTEIFSLRELYHSGVISISLISILLLGITAYCINRRKIMDFLFAAYRSKYSRIFVDEIDDISKPFDCFIAYCREDKEAATAIVEELEKKSPYYTTCTRDRNWALGSYIPTNVFQSVSRSRKTLIILSGAFAENRWFHLQFQVAFHQVLRGKGHGLILILKDLPEKTALPRDVRYYLDTRSSLQWGETWFWERLRYSLKDEWPAKGTESRDKIQYVMNQLDRKDEGVKDILEDIVI